MAAASVAAGFPAIVPASVVGSTAPSNRINVGAIGAGRISRGHDLPGIWKYDAARVVAVCDLDARRLEGGKRLVNDYHGRKTGRPCDGVTGYGHYLELLANTDMDAVVISTPDQIHLEESADQHGNWLQAIRTRRPPVAPVEVAHRSCSACLLHYIAMKAKRRLFWDPSKERFRNDDEANALLSRPQRAPYIIG